MLLLKDMLLLWTSFAAAVNKLWVQLHLWEYKAALYDFPTLEIASLWSIPHDCSSPKGICSLLDIFVIWPLRFSRVT